MRNRLFYAVFCAVNLVLGASSAQAGYRTVSGVDPITHQIVLYCEYCWFWNCDC